VPSPSFPARDRSGSDPEQRPLAASFAAAFGGLMTAEVLFLGALVVLPELRMDRVTVVVVVLLLAAAAASVMILQGRRGGWLLMVFTAVGALGALAILALVLGALGGTAMIWPAVLLMVGPLGCLVLAVGRPVRTWTDRDRTRRSAGGRRGTAGSR
jgi:hypothetical protein